MALTVASTALLGQEDPERIGRYLYRTRLWTLTSTYVTGGHPSTAIDLLIGNLGQLIGIEFPGGALFRPTAGTTAVHAQWSPGTGANRGLIQFFQSTTGAPVPFAEVANATSLSTFAGFVRVKYLG